MNEKNSISVEGRRKFYAKLTRSRDRKHTLLAVIEICER